jgi:hypothetical protein
MKAMEIVNVKGWKIIIDPLLPWNQSYIRYDDPRIIKMGTIDLQLHLAPYVLGHEIGHLMMGRLVRVCNFVVNAVDEKISEVHAWKWVFANLPRTNEALNIARACLKLYGIDEEKI